MCRELASLSLVVSPKVWQRSTEGKPHGLPGVLMQSSSALDEILEGLNLTSATHPQGQGTWEHLDVLLVSLSEFFIFVSHKGRSIKTHALL